MKNVAYLKSITSWIKQKLKNHSNCGSRGEMTQLPKDFSLRKVQFLVIRYDIRCKNIIFALNHIENNVVHWHDSWQ